MSGLLLFCKRPRAQVKNQLRKAKNETSLLQDQSQSVMFVFEVRIHDWSNRYGYV